MRCFSALALCACAVAATANSYAAVIDVTAPDNDIAGTQLVLADGSLDAFSSYPGGESPAQAIDNDPGSKFLSFQGAGLDNTGDQVSSPTGFVVVLDAPAAIGGVRFSTANDFASRDPGTVQIYGTNMTGTAADIADMATAGDLTLIYDGPTGIPAFADVNSNRDELQSPVYFPESAEYGAYVLIVTDLVRYDGNAPTLMQFAEVQLLQVPEPSTMVLLGLGGLGLAGFARRRRRV